MQECGFVKSLLGEFLAEERLNRDPGIEGVISAAVVLGRDCHRDVGRYPRSWNSQGEKAGRDQAQRHDCGLRRRRSHEDEKRLRPRTRRQSGARSARPFLDRITEVDDQRRRRPNGGDLRKIGGQMVQPNVGQLLAEIERRGHGKTQDRKRKTEDKQQTADRRKREGRGHCRFNCRAPMSRRKYFEAN